MPVRDYCRCEVRTVKGKATLREAAQLMADDGVGCVIVVKGLHARGLLTDRDLALRVLRDGLDPDTTPVSELLDEEPPAVVNGKASLDMAMLLMRRRGVRRLVVVDQQDEVTGIVTMDDLVPVLSRELADIASVMTAQGARDGAKWTSGPVVGSEGA